MLERSQSDEDLQDHDPEVEEDSGHGQAAGADQADHQPVGVVDGTCERDKKKQKCSLQKTKTKLVAHDQGCTLLESVK